MPSGSSSAWRDHVRHFQRELQESRGLAPLKELCKFLLDEDHSLHETAEVIEYLQDFISVDMVHYEFHRKWAERMPQMNRLLEQEQREMEKLTELIQALMEVEG